jgi:AraC-like DNA-binding protein
MAATPPMEKRPPPFVSSQVTSARRFYLDLAPPRRQPLAVVCGGWERCASDFAIDRQSFPYLALEFVAAGRGELQLAGRSCPLGPGSVFAYGPGIAQRIRSETGAPLLKYFVDFTGARGRHLLRLAQLAPGRILTVGAPGEIRSLFDQLIRCGQAAHRVATRTTALILEALLLSLAPAAPAAEAPGRRALATYRRCSAHLEAQFLEISSIEAAAAACHIDGAYLSRLFRRFAGHTPLQYLQKLQMNWAAEKLHASDVLIREIADELGVDPFQFSRTFKRVQGVSPSDFLKVRFGRRPRD